MATLESVFEQLLIGGRNRSVASTLMNNKSSRSHSIFTLTVERKNAVTGETTISKLNLVDLAGSERLAKSQVRGVQQREAVSINLSLTTLGKVINTLSASRNEHVPYRESALTYLLKNSLGGNSRTVLIINCSSSSWNESETVSTLMFGER